MTLDFVLNKLNLTLVNDMNDYNGVTLSATDFNLKMNMYDGTNKYNENTLNLDVNLTNYGLWVVSRVQEKKG